MSDCSLYIATFIVTALWDIVLRYMCENYSALPEVIKNTLPFIKDLIPYFKAHTVLAAALIAGFIGATTQMIIINIACCIFVIVLRRLTCEVKRQKPELG